MLEFMFFNDGLRRRFTDFVDSHGISATVAEDVIAGWVVKLPEAIADDTLEAVEACYEALMDEQERLAEEEEGWVERHLAGIEVALADGSLRMVRLDADTASRLLEHFPPRDVQALVESIARSLERDGNQPLCRDPGYDGIDR